MHKNAWHRGAVVVGLVVAAAGVGCGNADDQSEDIEVVDVKGDQTSAGVVGLWGRPGHTAGADELYLLDLRADKTFKAELNLSCEAIGCNVDRGTYKITRSTTGSTRYIRLTQDGELVHRYAFTVQGRQLSLRDTSTQAEFALSLREGEVQAGATNFISSADGMECAIPSAHCVTTDSSACPQLSLLPPDYCPDGHVVSGAVSYVTSADGMECAMPSRHCVTNDSSKCPQYGPLPPGYCAGGHVVQGPPKFVPSADGMECAMPNAHCVTNDSRSCPQLSPLPPDWCPGR